MSDLRRLLPHPDPNPRRPQKQIRKGTTSCWECKRRKTKCTYSHALTSIQCLTPESSTLATSLTPEASTFAQSLTPKSSTLAQSLTPESSTSIQSLTSESAVCDRCLVRGIQCVGQEYPDESAPRHIHNDTPGGSTLSPHPTAHTPKRPRQSGTGVVPPTPSIISADDINEKQPPEYLSFCNAWPTPQEMDFLLATPVAMPDLLCKAVHMLPGTQHDTLVPRQLFSMPRPGCQATAFARRLLILAVYIQGLHPGRVTDRHRRIQQRVAGAARQVTRSDDAVTSVEGIECLMLESMYEDNAGNLRRSWMVVRRAIAVAQMMGLHRAHAATTHDPKFTSDAVWLRLMQIDRYLSLILGLPQGSSGNAFASAKELQETAPIEKMRRIVCAAAGRVLWRNSGDEDSLEDPLVTREIDMMLQQASALMPPQWWMALPINVSNSEKNGNDVYRVDDFLPTLCLMDQLVHHHLVVQLHLPYLLRHSPDHRYDYSKLAVANSSREVLSRFVIFRTAYPVGSYCRGVDLLSFIASTALCVALLEAHRVRRIGHGGASVHDILAHQRPSDRGLIERVLECMERMGQGDSHEQGAFARKMAAILKHLLKIEAEATNDSGPAVNSTLNPNQVGEEDLERGGVVSDGGNVMRIYIPHLGTIMIERGGVSRAARSALEAVHDVYNLDGELDYGMESLETGAGAYAWPLQGVDMAFFDSLLGGLGGEDWFGGVMGQSV